MRAEAGTANCGWFAPISRLPVAESWGRRRPSGLETKKRAFTVRFCGSTSRPMKTSFPLKSCSGYVRHRRAISWPSLSSEISCSNTSATNQTSLSGTRLNSMVSVVKRLPTCGSVPRRIPDSGALIVKVSRILPADSSKSKSTAVMPMRLSRSFIALSRASMFLPS